MIITRLFWSAYLAYHMRGQAGYPFRPLDAILRDQARRVRAMVAYAYRFVPYYCETMDRLHLRPSDFRSADDLGRLPILECDDLQRDPEYFVSTVQPLEHYLRLRSGGSTGAPRTMYHDAAALFQNAAHGERERTIIAAIVGQRFGYRESVIASPFSSAYEVQRFCQAHTLFPRRARIQRQYLSLTDPPEKNVALLNEFKPHVIQSYGSYLGMLFPYLHATGTPFHHPRVVTFSSDGLSDPVRRLITRTFHIPVLSTYQAIEAFKIGFECQEHRGLHLNIDLYPLRIVSEDGKPLPVGESGDVVISNLVNRATVLLNYRLGDIIALLPEPCPCGRSLPLASFPQGRSDDWITLASGRLVHPQAVRAIFSKNEEQVWEYQVIQRTTTHFEVKVVAAATGDHQQIRGRILNQFANVFGADVTVDVAFVESIERTAAGKFRPVLACGQGSSGDRSLDR